jgi:hypothetical protein
VVAAVVVAIWWWRHHRGGPDAAAVTAKPADKGDGPKRPGVAAGGEQGPQIPVQFDDDLSKVSATLGMPMISAPTTQSAEVSVELPPFVPAPPPGSGSGSAL